MDKVREEHILKLLGNGNDYFTGQDIKEFLNEAGYQIVLKDNWQLIETAPKDGSIIVAYNPGSHSDNKYETVLWSDGAWRPRKDTSITYPFITHWQPLPNPPEKK